MPAKVTSSPVEADESVEDTAGRTEPTVAEPVADKSAVDKSAIDEPAVDKSAIDEPAVDKSAIDEPAVDKSAVDEPAADEPVVDKPVVDEKAPGAEAVAETEPAADGSAEPESAEPEPAASGKPAASRPRWRPSRWTALVAGLSVLLVALWVAGAFLIVHNRGVSHLASQRQDVLAAAQKVAGDLTSIGADNAPAQIQNLTGESTGAFRDQISTYAQALQTILQQSNAGSRGTVSAAGVEKMDANTASVLVTVAATVSNAKVTAGQPVSYRLAVQLQREGDRWLASDVTFVQ